MQIVDFPLLQASLNSNKVVSSYHYGQPGSGLKVYIQAGLHADEHPGMLVAHYLRLALQQEEAAGNLQGEVILVPLANPLGLDQKILGYLLGRFEQGSGQNFNRYYTDLAALVAGRVESKLGKDAEANVVLIRAAMLEALAELQPENELDSLRLRLQSLACDADILLDLHCDLEAALHLYIHSEQIKQGLELAQHLGCEVTLYAEAGNGQPFDEAHSGPWANLATRFPKAAIPMACFAATVELRGQTDVSSGQAKADAEAILNYLRAKGVLKGQPEAASKVREPKPLAAVEVAKAPSAGLVDFLVQPGQWVSPGQPLLRVINPLGGAETELCSSIEGIVYARNRQRYAHTGMELMFVSGEEPIRSGHLLSP
ncbi:succinylglutamate desuccinylase/aspartoacylase family protein [Balneatrix alpica]|uniref:succinylglutamate desuccinylase/aspartoacylase family protein n=1 Tax=Balneatrix alpica TaxID=75684 RepID=UPI002739174A|nr:succinylglutamate desuccinylase/aspartoacylase family protein [Balneatrix alpica]